MMITETTTVADIAAAIPSSVGVFQRHGIDFCCGGKKTLAAVCDERRLSVAELAAAIDASAAEPAPSDRDWASAPLFELVDHIVATYHDTLREQLPRLQSMAIKIARVHGAKDTNVARLERAIAEFSEDMHEHMHKEEGILFPSICARARGARTMPLVHPIRVMEMEHDRAGDLLTEMRLLTSHYTVPEWGCATVRALYRELVEVESAMHMHVHLENNVLFPRALALDEAA